jgi:hypothetical protein
VAGRAERTTLPYLLHTHAVLAPRQRSQPRRTTHVLKWSAGYLALGAVRIVRQSVLCVHARLHGASDERNCPRDAVVLAREIGHPRRATHRPAVDHEPPRCCSTVRIGAWPLLPPPCRRRPPDGGLARSYLGRYRLSASPSPRDHKPTCEHQVTARVCRRACA